MKFDKSLVQSQFESPLGKMILAATDAGLAGVWFDGQRHQPEHTRWPVDQAHPVLVRTREQLQQYFAGQRSHFDLPLDMRGGTVFQQQVWRALLELPYGQTCSYGEIGQALGKPVGARAVGAAVGRNPISIIVPCHRAVGANGSLTGYAGGLGRKAVLLGLEGANTCLNSYSAAAKSTHADHHADQEQNDASQCRRAG